MASYTPDTERSPLLFHFKVSATLERGNKIFFPESLENLPHQWNSFLEKIRVSKIQLLKIEGTAKLTLSQQLTEAVLTAPLVRSVDYDLYRIDTFLLEVLGSFKSTAKALWKNNWSNDCHPDYLKSNLPLFGMLKNPSIRSLRLHTLLNSTIIHFLADSPHIKELFLVRDGTVPLSDLRNVRLEKITFYSCYSDYATIFDSLSCHPTLTSLSIDSYTLPLYESCPSIKNLRHLHLTDRTRSVSTFWGTIIRAHPGLQSFTYSGTNPTFTSEVIQLLTELPLNELSLFLDYDTVTELFLALGEKPYPLTNINLEIRRDDKSMDKYRSLISRITERNRSQLCTLLQSFQVLAESTLPLTEDRDANRFLSAFILLPCELLQLIAQYV